MIQGKKKIALTKENILALISPYDIYRLYMPNKWELNKICHSPFRRDSQKSFIIGSKFGEITHKDFADSNIKGNCFNFVQQLLQCNYISALKSIDKNFSLGISSGEISRHTTIVTTYEQPEIEEKKYSKIQCVTRKFTNEELQYWNEYHQDIADLKANNVFSIKSVFLNKEKFVLKDTELRFGYLYDDRWKIYRPFNDSKTKWMPNNVALDTLEGQENIIDCDTAIITKSKKDLMVLKKVYPCVCAVQNESNGCFSKSNVELLKSNSKKQILAFDSDKAGVRNSLQITKQHDFGYLNVPRSYLSDGINDFAALGKEYGLETIKKILNRKKIIT
jgi:hypothetical protein